MSFNAIILAGGKSKRMRKDKVTLEIENKPMIIHILDALKIAKCKNILIQIKSKNTYEILEPLVEDYNVIWGYDEGDESNILEALFSALNTASKHKWNHAQLVPIDTPFLSPKLFENLNRLCKGNIEAVIPSSNSSRNSSSEGIEPLLSHINVKSAIKEILLSVGEKDRRLAKIFSRMNHLIIKQKQWESWGVNEKSFKNLNYPSDCE